MARQKDGVNVLSERVRALEAAEPAQMIFVSGSPVGVVGAALGTFAWDTTNNDLYVNNDGAAGWTLIGP